MKSEITKRLESLALAQTIPFCYLCYKRAPSGRCTECGSNDLMRLLEGIGCEYGTDWVIQYLLDSSVESVEVDLAFENSIADCYTETVKVGWITVDICDTIKRLDPVSWDLAKSEWIDSEEQVANLISFDFGGTYYWTCDIELYLEAAEKKRDPYLASQYPCRVVNTTLPGTASPSLCASKMS